MDAGLGRSVAVDRALAALIRSRGAAAWTDTEALRAQLRSAIPEQGGRIDLLVAAAEIGTVRELAVSPGRDSIREAQLAQRLVFERYYTDSDARFAVESWACALYEPALPAEQPAPTSEAAQPPLAYMPPEPPVSVYAPPPATAPELPRRHASLPSQTIAGGQFEDLGAPTDAARRPAPFGPIAPARRKGGPLARFRPFVVIAIVLFVALNMMSRCDSGASDSGSVADSSSGVTLDARSGDDYKPPTTPAETYAVDELGYEEALTVQASGVISALSSAPEPIRRTLTSYSADPKNADVTWLAVDSGENGAGYVLVRPEKTSVQVSTFTTDFIVMRSLDGEYNVSGPAAAQIPGQ